MTVIRWIIVIAAIVLVVVFGNAAVQQAAAAEGDVLPIEAFQSLVWTLVTFFSATLLLRLFNK